MSGKKYFLPAVLNNTQWGAKSFVALVISVVSGIFLAWQYNFAEAIYSVNSIDILIPFGAFFRSLHFYSSQMFFLFTLLHFWVIAANRTPLAFRSWFKLVMSLPVVLLLLFTGYILRGDTTGEAAGAIAENITLSVPYLGNIFDGMLFAIRTDGLQRVYANHLIGLGFLWLILSWDHIRKFIINWQRHALLLFGFLVFCYFVPAPVEPFRLGTFHIAGPWFFLGLQELLIYIPPFWAGIFFPSLLIVSLLLLQHKNWRKTGVRSVYCWLTIYLIATVVSWNRG